MAISMSGATVTTDTRDELLSKTVDGAGFGGESANTQGTGFLGLGGQEATGAALAGVTAEFASALQTAIGSYQQNVQTALDKLEAVESNSAFQGSAISASLKTFVESVKNTASEYLGKLAEAEQQIIDSVNAAYSTQDTDLSGQMNADSGNLGY